MCGPFIIDPCTIEEFSYSIPYRPERDGIAPLSIHDVLQKRCRSGCEFTTRGTTLGDELGEWNRVVVAGSRATLVPTFHGRRPVIVYWIQPSDAPDDDLVDRMRASFSFTGTPDEDPENPTELVSFTNAPLGYEIAIPRFWGTGTPMAFMHASNVQASGSGPRFAPDADPVLSITVGRRDGTVAVQDIYTVCKTVTARSLDELEALLVSVPDDLPASARNEVVRPLVLGGQPGRYKRPAPNAGKPGGDFGLGGSSSGHCLGCPGVRYHAFTIKDGRPVVISIDWSTIEDEELPRDYLADILRSFRFT